MYKYIKAALVDFARWWDQEEARNDFKLKKKKENENIFSLTPAAGV